MAVWNVTPSSASADGALPIFAGKNLINQDAIDYGTFSVSEMNSLVARIIDGDPFSYHQGSSESDATEVTYTFSFNVGSALQASDFDLVVLQNINWKNFVGEYSIDGSTWTTMTELDYSVSNNTATDLVKNPQNVPTTAKFIRFRVTATQTANAKKKCGGIIVCKGVVQLSGGFEDYKVKYRESVLEVELGDRSISREYDMRSATAYDFWGASFNAVIVTEAEKLLLRQIKRGGDPFILIPEPGDQPRDAYLCHFDGPWGHAYKNPVRSIGYEIPMKVKEVGPH